MNYKNLLLATTLSALVTGSLGAQNVQIDTTRVASGLNYPVVVQHAPGDTDRLFISEKRGRIKILDLATNQVLPTPFLDIDNLIAGATSLSDERGLLGIAFHPDFESNGHYFVYYTNSSSDTRVVRYTVSSSNPNLTNYSSAKTILSINQPYSNHNGGAIEFDCDGYLLVATGDGGLYNDPGNRSQDITNQLLGKILRLDINVPDSVPYAIPQDNPFVGGTGDDEILHYGLRNPWKIDVDPVTCELYIGDVGQNAREEINVVATLERGLNFGWRCMEGNGNTGLSGCTAFSPTLVDPVFEYNQSGSTGYSVTGGVVYRGCAIPELDGTYFFADYATGNIWSFVYNGTGGYTGYQNRNELETSLEGYGVDNIASFGKDANGEVYIVDQNGGEIFKIIKASGDAPCFDYPIGDINQDCLVNGQDLAQVLANWNSTSHPNIDLNDDGVVNGSDLSFILSYWNRTCE